MRVAIYSRVSTSHQVDHQTIEQQLGRLSAHVHAHATEGWKPCLGSQSASERSSSLSSWCRPSPSPMHG
jgi:DNA invertase Pin-like site-specific DNA recombinase